MDPIITNSLMTFGAGFTGAMFAKAQGPGQALDDIMTLVGFEKLHEVAEKKRALRDMNVQQYKNSIAQKIALIPEDNIQDPPLSIVGPALEASKYYISDEELREMFAQLIASSMDKSQTKFVHPSFVEIIKQISVTDAKNLELIYKSQDSNAPIGKYKLINKESKDTLSTMSPIVFLENNEFLNIDTQANSIINLARLGLIEYSFMEYYTDDSRYCFIENNNIYNELKNRHNDEFKEISNSRGIVYMTSYGNSFCKICLTN